MTGYNDPNLIPDDDRAIDRATGDEPRAAADPAQEVSETDRVVSTLQTALTPHASMPAELRERLTREGVAVVGGREVATSNAMTAPRPWWRSAGAAIAASVALLLLGGVVAVMVVQQRERALEESRERIAQLEETVRSNQTVIATARQRAESLDEQLAQAERRSLEIADRLARATEQLDRANLQIAQLEAPVDPVELRENRRRLLDVPGTVRLAWQPFDLPDDPALQQGVQGDVVWNDELQQGFLRFEGLAVNDPQREQYQVWIIDERGMEQKVSGGIFNASRDGEIVVPIEPGIDVGRVALFAVTVEDAGGTWVPDLRRRVVVSGEELDG